ncbi:hypothetical protein HPP92_028201 [Vanilla planifolia]|uniref:Dof-type domain-containing protein n=1 Tax=Vanilla planifolia TaxID=51239 RepID=A0A835P8P4_VANPL|nr:hypothetical protein HPP92_028201 [Vanilla planifolia]
MDGDSDFPLCMLLDTQEENDKVATSMGVAPQELNLKEPLHCCDSSSSAEVDQNPSAEIAKTSEELDLDEDHKESNSLEEGKILKKPDKVLPCPRCTSMDTKFCYYNNYNVNQPRHFCKNCQRYWTAGGR